MLVKINIPSRLHLTLISMHKDGYRQNGGIGFTIKDPSLEIVLQVSKKIEINDQRDKGFTKEEKERIFQILEYESKLRNFSKRYKASIKGNVPAHFGFGSSTAVRLVLIEGLYLVNEYKYTKEDIVKASERGGVSGIGIETYFHGGFVFDMGRANKNEFMPSSAMEKKEKTLPLLCKRIDMPSWQIGICLPNIKSKTENEEKKFFSKTCPIDEHESHKVLYHATYGVLASVMEDDMVTFSNAIKEIQKCEWKHAERELYGEELIVVEKALYDCGADAVGMSSLGATLFFVANDVDEMIKKAKNKLPKCQFYITDVDNIGRTITHD